MPNLQPSRRQIPLDPPVTDRPTRLTQQGSDLAIAVAAILAGQLHDIGAQPFGILPAPHLALRRTMLSERRTGARPQTCKFART